MFSEDVMDLTVGGIVPRKDSVTSIDDIHKTELSCAMPRVNPSPYNSFWYEAFLNIAQRIKRKYFIAAAALGLLVITAVIVVPILVTKEDSSATTVITPTTLATSSSSSSTTETTTYPLSTTPSPIKLMSKYCKRRIQSPNSPYFSFSKTTCSRWNKRESHGFHT